MFLLVDQEVSLLLFSDLVHFLSLPVTKTSHHEEELVTLSTGTIIGAAIGGVGAVIAAPIALGIVGFTGAGITAGSLAAQMMSSAAIANGGGVAAGSLVATLQSVGAAGLSTTSKIILGFFGSAVGVSVEEAAEALLKFIRRKWDRKNNK
ncbi:interferon alpha-inducible protein 27-like protein 2A [Cricetulus griseus]|uniref:Interferon alpha-inducible protein 27-like protein 2A n=1 Tax=Cricetulus griseus TaxID=10029 RepID=A0A9J7FZQ6_CRIGR|nr:interferon alpha-inducible protein 27-like protein 2A [Cricetulus griseus]XP_027272244.1 interferon alpha-inducible protein 27-like protein 2A [Cricetulus griseus]